MTARVRVRVRRVHHYPWYAAPFVAFFGMIWLVCVLSYLILKVSFLAVYWGTRYTVRGIQKIQNERRRSQAREELSAPESPARHSDRR